MKKAFSVVMLLLLCSVSRAETVEQRLTLFSDALSIDGAVSNVVGNIGASLRSNAPGETVFQSAAGMLTNSAAVLDGTGYSRTGAVFDQFAFVNGGALTAQDVSGNTGVDLNGTGAVNAAFFMAGVDIAIGGNGFSGSGLFVGNDVLLVGINADSQKDVSFSDGQGSGCFSDVNIAVAPDSFSGAGLFTGTNVLSLNINEVF